MYNSKIINLPGDNEATSIFPGVSGKSIVCVSSLVKFNIVTEILYIYLINFNSTNKN